jgi:multidrug resistance efflux pump
MTTVMVITYAGIVLVLFKLKLLKPRSFPIAWTIVVGVLIIGGIVVAWMLFAPMSPKVVATQYVIQLVPYVKGQVRKVHAQPNQPMKKGALLLEIDPTPYQNTLDQVQAQLQVAKENVNQAQAGLEAAQANVAKANDGVAQAQAGLEQSKAAVVNAQSALAKAKAADELAKTKEQIALNVQKANAGAISVLKVAEAVQTRQEADAAVNQAEASLNQAKAAEQQAVAGVASAKSTEQQIEASARQAAFSLKVAQSNVPGVEAQVAEAQFNLSQCKMYAPSDGFVVNWQVQDGTMLVSLPVAPAGTFINTSETTIGAAFPQNYLINVQPGDEVELVLEPTQGACSRGR